MTHYLRGTFCVDKKGGEERRGEQVAEGEDQMEDSFDVGGLHFIPCRYLELDACPYSPHVTQECSA